LGTKTSFFNFASELGEASTNPVAIIPTASPRETVDTATSSATTIDTETTATTIPVAVSTTKPTSTPSSVSIENSYVFASPLSAATGNVEKIRITVYILDGTGSGVSGKTVELTGVDDLAVYSIQETTDTTGRAIFDVAAGTSGSYEIGAVIGDTSFMQKVTVVFE
jgi:protocatechuate 3,4-dioxygenase beta subunit